MKSVSISTIANHLGLSRNTVSKVINNRGFVAENTKKKIVEAAITLGYEKIPQELLEQFNLEDKHNKLENKHILVVATSPDFSSFWGKIINGISAQLSEKGTKCFYHFLTEQEEKDFEMPIQLLGKEIAGMIVMNVYRPETLKKLAALNIPTVYLDSPAICKSSEIVGDVVLVESKSSVYEITEYLINQNKTQLGFIGDITYCKSINERWRGFTQALEDYHIPLNPKYCLTKGNKRHFYAENELEEIVEKTIKASDALPEAWVCANDVIAFRLIKLLRKYGYSIPNDLSISGFDDEEEMFVHEKILTSVAFSKEDLGKRLARQILWRIKNPNHSYEIIKLRGEVVFRASTGGEQ